ncbi:sulfatase-like hydrolase/transferase [Humisphaera borealis]|uniref:Sulfatase-like hydrolase/transferase n=1 Tax=Humisphaera borealis TaxID=2807512 RepID=A0A7M2WXY9_9BACT|nr:sulfatase-like hydrolase/transferase [Humisphaera borealis]QOV90368.1 sulfatase-like hydrolase/transferase [Humisphaera borealis]
MNRLLTLCAAIFLTCGTATRAVSAAPPNIVVILSDDQGWGDLSIHGNTNLSTPNIDSLARDGAMFDRFYVCPVCSPTRAEFMTGRYHPRGGVRNVSTGGERLDLDEKTIADTFKAAGYKTGAFGKWHNGTQFPYHPNARGFEEYYGFTSGHWGDYFDALMDHNGDLVTGKGYMADDLTDHAMQFMSASKDKPFFCYVPYNIPHSPMQVPDRFYAKFAKADLKLRDDNPGKEDLEHTRAALAMCEAIDWNVGRILKHLDDLKLADNTIVLYFSDNGPNGFRWNGGMKGKKGSVDEGGVRSPLLIRYPGKIAPGTRIPQISGAIDLLPTLADFAGVKVLSNGPLDGRSLVDVLTGKKVETDDRMIFSHWNRKVSVRTQQYRLMDGGILYDMAADPGQKTDVARQNPQIAEKLSAALAAWKAEMFPMLSKDDRPYTVGSPEHPLTQLPARDGVPHGNVKRSSGAPNCSYFVNWTSTDDRITWDVEVKTAGRYEVVVWYSCPAAEVGSEIELSLGDVKTTTRIAEPHDPPLRGKEHDRTASRGGESYVKDWKPLSLGSVNLTAGRGELTLKAVKVASKQVAEVRMVLLTRK